SGRSARVLGIGRRVSGGLSGGARRGSETAARPIVLGGHRGACFRARSRPRSAARVERREGSRRSQSQTCRQQTPSGIGSRAYGRETGGRALMATRRGWVVPAISLVLTLVLGVLPLPEVVEPLRPDWMAVVLIYWSLMSPRKFSLLTAFWMGLAIDTLSGALL